MALKSQRYNTILSFYFYTHYNTMWTKGGGGGGRGILHVGIQAERGTPIFNIQFPGHPGNCHPISTQKNKESNNITNPEKWLFFFPHSSAMGQNLIT